MKHYSIANKEKFDSLKEDIKGSLSSAIDKLFEGAHLVAVNTSGNATYITAEYVDEKGAKKTSVLWVDSLMFRE
jgi:hypothetical protein